MTLQCGIWDAGAEKATRIIFAGQAFQVEGTVRQCARSQEAPDVQRPKRGLSWQTHGERSALRWDRGRMISSVERSVAVDTEGRMARRNSSYPGQDDGGRGGGPSGSGEESCSWNTCWRWGRSELVMGGKWRR